jgi:hypothetical protein
MRFFSLRRSEAAPPRFDFLIQFFTLNQARCSGSFVRIFGDQGPGLPQSHIAVDGRYLETQGSLVETESAQKI